MPTVAVISDTHNFLDPAVKTHCAGAEHILHGGDVGSNRILTELESIAPVTAVLGNTDDPHLGLRETEVVTACDRKFLLHHIVDPSRPAESIQRRIELDRPDVVVFGHTHRPFSERIGGTLFLNPGSAGRARFHQARTMALIQIGEGELDVKFIELGP